MNQQFIKNIFNQWICVDADDFMGKRIKNHGLYDAPSIYFMRSLLKKINQPVVLDIGANIGNHLLPILPIVKKAIAFEPQPKIFDMLKQSVEKNKFGNCIIKNYGLGCKDEHLTFYENVSGNNGGSSFVAENYLGVDKKVLNLPIKNGDAVLDDLAIQKLDFIKIDVEGFEFEVFEGMKNHIKKYAPMILMEWHAHTTGRQFLDNDMFNNTLSGYQVIALERVYSWWVKNKLWSIRSMVDKSQISRFKFADFNPKTNYNNVFLFKKEHQPIVNEMIKSKKNQDS